MKDRLLEILSCPACGGELKLEKIESAEDKTVEGILYCPTCSSWYPITNNIPRLLVGELREDYSEFYKQNKEYFNKIDIAVDEKGLVQKGAQVQQTFEFKWNKLPKWGIEGDSVEVFNKFFLDKFGWESLEDYYNHVADKRYMLDAGCGLGREAWRLGQSNKDALVIGMELSGCADAAYENCKEAPNVEIVQGNLLESPFKDKTFDFIIASGVLHHTPDTHQAFKALIQKLSANPGSEIAIYVYRKKSVIREFTDDYIRAHIKDIDPAKSWDMMKAVTKFGKSLSKQNITFEIPEDIPVLGWKAGKYNLQRFFYWHIFKCYWNDGVNFDENNLVNFDWYQPKFAWRHTEDEVRGWYEEAALKIIHFHIQESGITVRGVVEWL